MGAETNLRILAVAVAIAVLSTPGCVSQPADCARADVRCAALVTAYGGVEEGLAKQAWLALQDAHAAGLIDRADYIATVDTRDRGPNLAHFARLGYDTIVTIGAGMIDETLQTATAYPSLRFVGIQQEPQTEPVPTNYTAMMFHEEESGFLGGAVAALVTRTRHVAAICEVQYIDSVRRYCEGFRAGVKYVDAGVDAEVFYRNGSSELLFRDAEWGTRTAEVALQQGADVVFAVGQDTARAALERAAKDGALVIGAETDQHNDAPLLQPRLVTSAILDARSGLLQLLQSNAQSDEIRGIFWAPVGLAPFYDYGIVLPEAHKETVQEIMNGLQARTISVGVPFEVP